MPPALVGNPRARTSTAREWSNPCYQASCGLSLGPAARRAPALWSESVETSEVDAQSPPTGAGVSTTVIPQAPPQPLVDFAGALLRHEAAKAGNVDEVEIGFRAVCRALHERLSPLISAPGFETLLGRAITLAARTFPVLASLNVATDGDCAVSGVPGVTETHAPTDVADALTAVLAYFLWLLVTFIGENLGLRKVREVWPEVAFGRDPSSGTGE